MRVALLALHLLAAAPPAPAEAPAALRGVAAALAAEIGPPVEGRASLLLVVEPRPAALRGPLETALDGALAARGYAVVPHRAGGDPEEAARAGGQDWVLRVRGGVAARELAVVGELIPAWPSFFLQRRPGARAVPPRIVQARAAADPATLLIAREGGAAGAPFAAVRPLARVPGRVLALAVGRIADDGPPAVAAVTDDGVRVLSAAGEGVAERAADPAGRRPLRDPAATVAVGDFGGGRLALRRADAARGEVLALRGDRLEPAGELDAAPLCGGEGARLFGAFEPGSGVLRDVLTPHVDPGAPPRSARTLYGVACAPRGGPVAVAVLATDLALELLGPELRPVAPGGAARAAALATGSGFALADLDGDGRAELVASSPAPGGPDRIRVLAPLAEAPLLVESGPVAGAVLAGAGGDLTGDGLDDAVLAAVGAGADGAAWTELLLVTSDAREVP